MTALVTLLDSARAKAMTDGLPARRKDAGLYAVLAGCLFLVEKVERDGLHDELYAACRARLSRRRFIMAKNEVPLLVCRYVLEGADNRNSVYRYAATLKQAHQRQIGAAALAAWLADNGGVRALFLRRPLNKTTALTKVLHLNSAIEVPTSGPFAVTLVSDGMGFFNVVSSGRG